MTKRYSQWRRGGGQAERRHRRAARLAPASQGPPRQPAHQVGPNVTDPRLQAHNRRRRRLLKSPHLASTAPSTHALIMQYTVTHARHESHGEKGETVCNDAADLTSYRFFSFFFFFSLHAITAGYLEGVVTYLFYLVV